MMGGPAGPLNRHPPPWRRVQRNNVLQLRRQRLGALALLLEQPQRHCSVGLAGLGQADRLVAVAVAEMMVGHRFPTAALSGEQGGSRDL